MGVSPWMAGATGPGPWTLTFTTPPVVFGGQPVPVSLIGAALPSVTIRNNWLGPNDPDYERVGTGTWTISDPTNGVATYQLSAADVASAGDFSLIFSVVVATGQKLIWPAQRWVVNPS